MTAIAEPPVLRARVTAALARLDVDGFAFATADPVSGLENGGFAHHATGRELRVELTAHGLCWGRLSLYRTRDFSRAEQAAVRRTAAELTALLMEQALRVPVGRAQDRVGVVHLDEHGHIDSINDHARDLFTALGDPPPAFGQLRAELLRGERMCVMLLPDLDLGWLRLHGTLQHSAGRRCVAVTLQSASPLQIAPILLAARGATPRAVQVTLRVLRGMTSAEIAEELRISPHTVQDHLKPVFTALAVNSRRQLISSLFPDLKPYEVC